MIKTPDKYIFKSWWVKILFSILDSIGYFLVNIYKKIYYKGHIDLATSSPKKILVIRLDHIGDVLLTTPAIRALRRKWPDSEIDVVVGPWSELILRNNTDVDNLLVYRAPWFDRKKKRGFGVRSLFGQAVKLQTKKYDLAVDFRGDFRNILLMFLARIPLRIGYDIGGGGVLLTHTFTYQWNAHTLDKNLNILKPVVPPVTDRKMILDVNNDDINFVRSYLEEKGVDLKMPIVGIHPGAGTKAKLWINNRFSRLIDWIIDKYPDCQVVVTGSSDESYMIEQITSQLRHKALNLAGDLTLSRLVALISQLDVLIAVDSAPIHIAGALDIPTVSIFSGTNRMNEWKPENEFVCGIQRSVECQPCERIICFKYDHDCMNLITSRDVFNIFNKVFPREKVKNMSQVG